MGEEGQYAVSLIAPDRKALTMMVGNAGMPANYRPGQFVHDKLMGIRPRISKSVRRGRHSPSPDFSKRISFDVSYQMGSNTTHGIAKCSIANTYDSALMVMTAALANSQQWACYAGWLPLVAEQISATNGGAFGRRGIMAQNLRNSVAYGEASQRYRDWSQKNWQGVTDQRNESQDRNNAALRENLGSTHAYVNPYHTSAPVDMPNPYSYYWVDRHGNYLGTDDPSVNPNEGSTGEWKKMPRQQH